VEIEALTSELREIEVECRGHKASVTYRPGIFTIAYADSLSEVLKSEEMAPLAAALEQLIEGWDLTAGGEPLPASAEGISRVPFELLNAIQQAIADDSQPSEAEKKGSSESSGATPAPEAPSSKDSESSPTGTGSSTSPASSESPPGSSQNSESAGSLRAV
jgi:hypothetical protein